VDARGWVVINDAHHWAIVWRALRVAVEARDQNLVEATADMVAKREGASAYEDRRAYVEAQTKRTRARLDGGPDPDDDPTLGHAKDGAP
jgi:hypothetical protein